MFSYHWSNGASSALNYGLGAGTYRVTVTDGCGCTGTAIQLLDEPEVITVSETIDDILCAGDTNGAIYITVSGGTPSYAYLWSDGTNADNISGLDAGYYSLTVTDANNCEEVRNYTINSVSQSLQIIQSVNQVLCYGDENGEIILNAFGGTEPYSFRVTGT